MIRSNNASHISILKFLTLALFMAGALAGCSLPSFDFGSDDDEEVELWHSHDEFVRLEARNGGAPNNQPIKLSRERIKGALRNIFVRQTIKDDPTPLFSEVDLQIIGRYTEEGLAKASPDQDVTFAIESWHKGFFGLKTEKVITGRFFYVNNQLNLIFGSVMRDAPMHEGYGELSARNPDPRLNPYVPGLRAIRQKADAILSTPSNSGIFRAASNRSDWLIFSPQALVAGGPVAAPGKRAGRPPAGSATAATGDYRQLREEVNRLKQELRKGRQGIPGQQQTPPDSATIEKRLAILEKLHQRGLISAEELAAKRQQILQGL
ncbi:MAG: SHOCT domain-containing protein [Alphaproteobacteria bacterium]|nr:SHOCT domain-containing protein [Alphaproteobacteria bacterium]